MLFPAYKAEGLEDPTRLEAPADPQGGQAAIRRAVGHFDEWQRRLQVALSEQAPLHPRHLRRVGALHPDRVSLRRPEGVPAPDTFPTGGAAALEDRGHPLRQVQVFHATSLRLLNPHNWHKLAHRGLHFLEGFEAPMQDHASFVKRGRLTAAATAWAAKTSACI